MVKANEFLDRTDPQFSVAASLLTFIATSDFFMDALGNFFLATTLQLLLGFAVYLALSTIEMQRPLSVDELEFSRTFDFHGNSRQIFQTSNLKDDIPSLHSLRYALKTHLAFLKNEQYAGSKKIFPGY